MQLSSGSKLGRYLIVSSLGKGGMGEVYRAKDTTLNREVAIKVVSRENADKHESLKRFEREAKAVATLSHPNVLQIYDFGVDEGLCYAVMELLEGETLRSRILKSRITVRTTLEFGICLAEG